MTNKKNMGFTLIELLVVIGVLALLAAILFPVYTSAKQSALKTKCQSNLEQMNRAFSMYLSDYGSYPNTGNPKLWMGRHFRWPLKKYIGFYASYDSSNTRGPEQETGRWGTTLWCPSDPNPPGTYDGTSYAYSAAFYHSPNPREFNEEMVIRDPLFRGGKCVNVKDSHVRFPSKKVLVAEWNAGHSDKKYATWWGWEGSRNYLFADGHIQYLEARRIYPALGSYPDENSSPDVNRTVNGVAGKDID